MKSFLLFLVFLFTANSIQAIDRPRLTINFKLEEELFSIKYFDDKDFIEQEVAERLIPALNEYLCFAQFEPGNDLHNTFTIILDNINRSDDIQQLHEVYFFFELNGTNVKPHEPVEPWLFLNKSAYMQSQGSAEDFISKIVVAFTGKLKFDYTVLVEKLFCNLVLSDQALIIRERAAWVLPLKRNELGVDNQSRFIIVNEAQDPLLGTLSCSYQAVMIGDYTVSNSDVPEDYKMGILVRHSENEDLCNIFQNSSIDVEVKEVTLKLFRRKLSEDENPAHFDPTINTP